MDPRKSVVATFADMLQRSQGFTLGVVAVPCRSIGVVYYAIVYLSH